jgi:2,3-bisphosphoglycerate-dependent phosphoglycerate mutase
MEIYLIRHAESANNAQHESHRVPDPTLTQRGFAQAQRLATWVHSHRPDVILTSGFRRAIESIAPACHAIAQPPHVWVDLHERGGCYAGFGDGPYIGHSGLGRSAIDAMIPGTKFEAAISEQGWWKEVGKESDEAAGQRADRVLQRLIDTFGPQRIRVAVMTHADFIRLLIERILEHSTLVDRLGPLHNAAVTHLRWADGQWRIDAFNASSHLPVELITPQNGDEAPGSMPPLSQRLRAG